MLKRYSIVLALLVIVVAIAIGVSVDITSRWNNEKYWTYEKTVSELKKSPGTITRETTNGVEVVFEYGLLYSIQTEGDKVKLNFSYEPYDVYQLRTPTNRNPETDLSFTVDTKSDAKPSAFLGRIDKSIISIKSMGTNSALVTAGKIQFSYSKPKMEIQALFNHYINVITGKKSDYIVKISSWYVEDLTKLAQKSLNNLTPERKVELRKKWKEETEKYLAEYYGEEELLSNKYNTFEFLAQIGDRFIPINIDCRDWNGAMKCVDGYAGSPGTNLLLYSYVRNTSGKTLFYTKFREAASKGLYPFGQSRDNNVEHAWYIMQNKGFPACPVTDIIQGNTEGKNIEFFKDYYAVRGSEMLREGTKDVEIIAQLKAIDVTKYNPESPQVIIDSPERDYVDSACYRVIKGKSGKAVVSELKNFYNRVYTQILTVREKDEKGELTIKKVTLDEYIAYSKTDSYGNYLLTDNIIINQRLDNIDTPTDQINEKTQFKMLTKSLIIMYLYELYQ